MLFLWVFDIATVRKGEWLVCIAELSHPRDFIGEGCINLPQQHGSRLLYTELSHTLCGRKISPSLPIFGRKRHMMAHFQVEEPCNTLT